MPRTAASTIVTAVTSGHESAKRPTPEEADAEPARDDMVPAYYETSRWLNRENWFEQPRRESLMPLCRNSVKIAPLSFAE